MWPSVCETNVSLWNMKMHAWLISTCITTLCGTQVPALMPMPQINFPGTLYLGIVLGIDCYMTQHGWNKFQSLKHNNARVTQSYMYHYDLRHSGAGTNANAANKFLWHFTSGNSPRNWLLHDPVCVKQMSVSEIWRCTCDTFLHVSLRSAALRCRH